MRIVTPETDTGGRADSDADLPGAILSVLAARESIQHAAERSGRPLGAMIAANTMPPDVVSEFSGVTKA